MKTRGLYIQRHNELRDVEAEILNVVCQDVEVEPVLQEITGEVLPRGSNKAPDARHDIHASGFWVKFNLSEVLVTKAYTSYIRCSREFKFSK